MRDTSDLLKKAAESHDQMNKAANAQYSAICQNEAIIQLLYATVFELRNLREAIEKK